MGTFRSRARRLTAREAEKLLTGQPVPADRRGLARLLAAAAAPAWPGELAGERAAVEGFRIAYRLPPERPRRIGPALGRTALVKLAAVAAVVFLGGTALAAGTGELPGPAQQSVHDLFSPLGVPAPPHEPAGSGPGRHGAGPPPSTPAAPPARPAGPGNPAGGPTPSPTPDLVALCRGYLATLDAHGQPDPAVRQQLAAAAGDAHKIPEFCTRLLHGRDASGGGDAPGRGDAPGGDGHHAHSATGPSSPP